MPHLSGVVELDHKSALADLREWRRELRAASHDSTRFHIEPDYDGAKLIRQVKTDFRSLQKLGSEHKISIQATADGKQAIETLGHVKTELGDIGKNPRVVIHAFSKSGQPWRYGRTLWPNIFEG